jgi:serine/threonine-protein kinase
MEMELLTGQTINGYAIGPKINEGLFGEIYQATSPDSITVAIKFLRVSLVVDEHFRKRFFREITLLQAVQHEHIVPTLDFGFQGQQLYLVMPLFKDETLHQLLGKKQFTPLDAWGFVEPICGALTAGHDKGIIHRDLKPENVLVKEREDGSYTYFLLDFGLAKRPGVDMDLTLPGTKLGTPEYIPPEMVRDESVDVRSDIYSLSVMVYELLLGTLPFEMESLSMLVMAHAKEPPPIPSVLKADFPRPLEAFLLKNLAKDKDTRHQSMAEFAQAYHNALTSLPADQQQSCFWIPRML